VKNPLIRWGLAAFAALALLFTAYHFLTAPSRARQETAVAQASLATAEGQKAAAQDAIQIIVDTQSVHGRIDVITKENEHAIRTATGAADEVGAGVHSAGLAALCLRDTYRLQPTCQRLLADGAPDAP
jgi:hypothetical protein